MPTKQEVLDMIRDGQEEVRKTFPTLSEEQLRTQIHEEENGWTAKQILAHLATNYDRVQSFLQPGASHETLFGDALVGWNQVGVDRLSVMPFPELLAECGRVHQDLARMVEGMSEDELNREMPWGQGTAPLSDVIFRVGGRHCVGHSQTVANALGIAQQT